jgi:tripeptidyl-peptidase-1
MFYSLTALCSLAIGAQTVFGTPIRSRTAYSVKESHNVPQKWKNLGRAPSDHMLHMQFGLKQGNFAELDRQLYEGMLLISKFRKWFKLTTTSLRS